MNAMQAAGLVSARAWRSRGCPYPRCECNGCGHQLVGDAIASGPCERPWKWRPAAFRHTPATSRRFYTPQIMARLRPRAPDSKVEHVSTGRHGRVAGCFPGGNRITRWLTISRRSATGLPSSAGGLRTVPPSSTAAEICVIRRLFLLAADKPRCGSSNRVSTRPLSLETCRIPVALRPNYPAFLRAGPYAYHSSQMADSRGHLRPAAVALGGRSNLGSPLAGSPQPVHGWASALRHMLAGTRLFGVFRVRFA